MAQKNFIKQQQVLRQKLSHQNIQLFKMMELNLLQFEQRVKEEIDINPALENLDNFNTADEYEHQLQEEKILESSKISLDEKDDFFQSTQPLEMTRDMDNQSSKPDYSLPNFYDDDERELFVPVIDHDTTLSTLQNQLQYFNLTEKQLVIGEYIIGNLDDDGYLRRDVSSISDDLAFRNNLIVSEEEIKEIIQIIQEMDPAGIGAANLQECLILQLQRAKANPHVLIALDIVTHHFDLYSKRQYDRIAKKFKLSSEEFDLVNKEILNLNPKPTEKILNEDVLGRYIIPDFTIYTVENKLELELHSYNQPNLSISPEFVTMLKKLKADKEKSNSEKEAQDYLKDKINKASLFISLVKERQETMIIIMHSIMQRQKRFFMSGDESQLEPMALKHIAADTNFDISTVSRVTSSKYVQTEFGVFSLKFFFSEGLVNESGLEISNRTIMKKLEEIVAAENKQDPYSDDELTDELKKSGYTIARRTTAKYRENLHIPPRHLRKNK